MLSESEPKLDGKTMHLSEPSPSNPMELTLGKSNKMMKSNVSTLQEDSEDEVDS
jgi:hypothetical protein